RHIGAEREQLLALERQRRRLLALGAADVDLLIEVDRAPARSIESRIARRHALHALARLAVAVGAGLAGRADLALPQRLAIEHREGAGIGSVVVLHGARVAAHEVVAGLALVERDLG